MLAAEILVTIGFAKCILTSHQSNIILNLFFEQRYERNFTSVLRTNISS
jgi:hypothetical protein